MFLPISNIKIHHIFITVVENIAGVVMLVATVSDLLMMIALLASSANLYTYYRSPPAIHVEVVETRKSGV